MAEHDLPTALARDGRTRIHAVLENSDIAVYLGFRVTHDLDPRDPVNLGHVTALRLHRSGAGTAPVLTDPASTEPPSRICECGLPLEDGEHTGQIAENVALHWDRDQPINPATLHGVLDQPATTVWSGACVVAGESADTLSLRLTGTEPRTGRFAAEPVAVESGLCDLAFTYCGPALAGHNSLAYLTLRGLDPDATKRRWELGAIATAPPGGTSPNASASPSAVGSTTAPPNPSSSPTGQASPTNNWPTAWSSTSISSGW